MRRSGDGFLMLGIFAVIVLAIIGLVKLFSFAPIPDATDTLRSFGPSIVWATAFFLTVCIVATGAALAASGFFIPRKVRNECKAQKIRDHYNSHQIEARKR